MMMMMMMMACQSAKRRQLKVPSSVTPEAARLLIFGRFPSETILVFLVKVSGAVYDHLYKEEDIFKGLITGGKSTPESLPHLNDLAKL